MLGDIEMNDTATVVAKDDEDEQNSEGCGRQSEKVERVLSKKTNELKTGAPGRLRLDVSTFGSPMEARILDDIIHKTPVASSGRIGSKHAIMAGLDRAINAGLTFCGAQLQCSSDERCILAACVAPPSNAGGILGRRALPARRLTCLGATPDFHHVLLGRQEPGIGTLASYDWLDLRTPEGYDRLVEVLDPEFDPKGIAQRLKTQLTRDAKGMLVEHGYIDKDYRSTFYNFYAKMGRQYRPDCVRLHFFDSTVSYDEARGASAIKCWWLPRNPLVC